MVAHWHLARATSSNMAVKRKKGLLDNFFTVVSKMPKGTCSTFSHFNSIRRLAKRFILSAQDNFQASQ